MRILLLFCFSLLASLTSFAQQDAQVSDIYTLGQLPIPFGNPHTVQALIKNNRNNSYNNITVTLNVTGANTYTDSKVISLNDNESQLVTFTAYAPVNNGVNTISVSLPNDDNNGNNSKSYTQVTNADTYSYADASGANGSIGISGGILLTKYTAAGSIRVTDVKVHLNTAAGNGNTVYGVVLNAAGNIIGMSDPYITVPADLNAYKNFTIRSCPVITNTEFYVGLLQTANNCTMYYPVSTQTENNPGRNGAYYYSSMSGGMPDEYNTGGRFMIQAVVAPVTLPFTDASVDAVYSLRKIPVPLSSMGTVKARVINAGTTALSGLPVTLTVSGANSFTETRYVNLAAGSQSIVTFTNYPAWNAGTNNIVVSIPSDDISTNNSKSFTQEVNDSLISSVNDGPVGGSAGFGTDEGILFAGYSLPNAIVKKVRVKVSKQSCNIGNTITGVAMVNYMLYYSAPHVITAQDLGNWVSMELLTSPSTDTYNPDMLVGVLQNANTLTGYYPVGVQWEDNPQDDPYSYLCGATYASSAADGSNLTGLSSTQRLAIEPVVEFLNTPPLYSPASSNTENTIAAWDFSGIQSSATMNASVQDTHLASQVILSRGSSAPVSSGYHGFRTNGFQNDGISTANTDYFQFTITPNAGDTLSLSTLSGYVHGNSDSIPYSGISYQFAYSLDGVQFNLIGQPITVYDNTSSFMISLAGIPALQNIINGNTVTFRYYASGTGAAEDWGFISPSTGDYGLTLGGFINAHPVSVLTDGLMPAGAPFNLSDCNTAANGSIGFRSTGSFGANNKYIALLGWIYQPQSNIYIFRPLDTIGVLQSNANQGTINLSYLPTGETGYQDSYVVRVISTEPHNEGTISQIFSINTISGANCRTRPMDYFRSRQSGNWSQPDSWESSNNGANWITATMAPDYRSAGVEIGSGDTITVNSNISISRLRLKGKLKLLNDNNNKGTMAVKDYPFRLGPFSVRPLYIDTSGVLQIVSGSHAFNDVILPIGGDFSINAGRIVIGDGTNPSAGGFERLATSAMFFWYAGSVFEWNSPGGSMPGMNETYFPDNDEYSPPILRFSKLPSSILGGDYPTTINGLTEVNTPLTWVGSGTKTFRDGLAGNSVITQGAGCGAFLTGSSYVYLPPTNFSVAALRGVLNGRLTINLNSNGYTLQQGIRVYDTADVLVNGTINSLGAFEVAQNGRLTLGNGSIVDIQNADLTNEGSTYGPGIIRFTGNQPSIMSSPGLLTAPVKLISKELSLGSNSQVADMELLSHSHLTLHTYHLNLHTAPLVADSVNFIVTNNTGMLQRSVDVSAIQFPVGIDTGSYTPLTITNTGTPMELRVRVNEGVTDLPSIGNVNRTWFVDTTQAGGLFNLTAQWNEPDEQSGFRRNQSFISQSQPCLSLPNCTGQYYDVIPKSPASGSNPYSQSRINISSPSSFIIRSMADTSFFTGSGSWDTPGNWEDGIVPSKTIPESKVIVIMYGPGGECTVTGDIILQNGGQLILRQNRTLKIDGNVILQ